jgi:hypothetical protein
MTKPKHSEFNAPFLDEEERALIEPIERSGLKSGKSRAQALAEWCAVVKNTQRKKTTTGLKETA